MELARPVGREPNSVAAARKRVGETAGVGTVYSTSRGQNF
jgi:hypothetical protein